MDDRSTRAHALELASRHGLPPDLTLRAARSYLAFITDKEPPAFDIADTWRAVAVTTKRVSTAKAKTKPKKPGVVFARTKARA